jgi:putative ABC transport system substrate-binding protein
VALSQPTSLPLVGFLAQEPVNAASQPLYDAFLKGLAENGLVPGRNFLLEYRYNSSNYERMAEHVTEFVKLGAAVLVTPSTQSAQIARRITQTVPLVIVAAGDPVGSGLAVSLAKPGTNVTGMSSQGVDFATKQLELLLAMVPHAKRIAIVMNPENAPHAAGLAQVLAVAPAKGLEIFSVTKRSPEDVDPAIRRVADLGCSAMIMFDDPVLGATRAKVIALANANRLPAIYQWRLYVGAGGLMSFGPNLADLFRRSASHIARLLRGENPAEMPIEQPTQFDLVINLKTVKALGLIAPPALLARADEVIE